MPDKIDHIIKDALGDYEIPGSGDWESFYEMWKAEEEAFGAEGENNIDFDESVRESIGDTDYEVGEPDWTSFAALMDTAERKVGAEEDQKFDSEVKTALEDYVSFPMDPDHWRKFSLRLDQLNNRPRMILMKVAEVAAVIFILYQLSYFYNDYTQERGGDSLMTLIDKMLGKDSEPNESIVAPNQLNFPDVNEDQPGGESHENIAENDASEVISPLREKDPDSEIKSSERENEIWEKALQERNRTSVTVFSDPSDSRSAEIQQDKNVAKMLPSPEIRIDYVPSGSHQEKPMDRLALQDISLIQMSAHGDTLLNMSPTFQVVRPRLYSTFETGVFADATTIQIQDAYPYSDYMPRNEFRLNPGLFLRYKIMYKNLYGSIGADYVGMKYSGLNHLNEISMVSLPFELGYNIVNISSFRFYMGGGVAGRFVPVARYSSESFNLASDYNKLEKKKTNGLLNNGPFEINSYLSGRFSIGFDANILRNVSLGLRYSHDFWLKGEGIGFNYDKFKSSHLALGIGYQF